MSISKLQKNILFDRREYQSLLQSYQYCRALIVDHVLSSIVKLVLLINIRRVKQKHWMWLNIVYGTGISISKFFSKHMVSRFGMCLKFFKDANPFLELSGIIFWCKKSFVECEPGYVGTNCSTTCPQGYFGRRCLGLCNCSRDMYCEAARGCLCITTIGNCTDQGIIR